MTSESSTQQSTLTTSHGELLRGAALRRALGYGSDRSFYRAAISGETPVPVFKIEGRSGWHAKTRDIDQWLAKLGTQSTKRQEPKPGS